VPFALSLSRYFHVYLFDNPGFGESPLGKPLHGETAAKVILDADLSEQSAVFAAMFQSWAKDGGEGWDGRAAHVIAHDHGGLMALRAHLLHGCEYASLCLIDVVAVGPFGHPLFKLVAENEGVFKQLTGPVFEGVVEAYIRDAAHKQLDGDVTEMLKTPWLRSKEGREGFVRQMCGANSRSNDEVEGRYAEVGAKVPVQIIWGRDDKWLPVETADKLAKALNAKEVVVIEEAGHLIMYDQGARLGVELAWWLSSVSR
jgi:pimeloyl-ACP methyl ester carboxylesterase